MKMKIVELLWVSVKFIVMWPDVASIKVSLADSKVSESSFSPFAL